MNTRSTVQGTHTLFVVYKVLMYKYAVGLVQTKGGLQRGVTTRATTARVQAIKTPAARMFLVVFFLFIFLADIPLNRARGSLKRLGKSKLVCHVMVRVPPVSPPPRSRVSPTRRAMYLSCTDTRLYLTTMNRSTSFVSQALLLCAVVYLKYIIASFSACCLPPPTPPTPSVPPNMRAPRAVSIDIFRGFVCVAPRFFVPPGKMYVTAGLFFWDTTKGCVVLLLLCLILRLGSSASIAAQPFDNKLRIILIICV